VSELAERLRAATPLVERVDVERIGDRVIASVHLNAAIVRGRAEQQGLSDSSIAAAAQDARVQRLLATVIAGTGAACKIVVPDGDAVVVG